MKLQVDLFVVFILRVGVGCGAHSTGHAQHVRKSSGLAGGQHEIFVLKSQ